MTDGEKPKSADQGLTNLLNETRILLPGTEVFLGFLTTLPFSEKFESLDGARRVVYICTFSATLLSLVLFVMPAAYHRIAGPIDDKERFKIFANRFLIAGLVPMSVSMVSATYLVAYVVMDRIAIYLASAFALLIIGLWWVIPLVRAHDSAEANAESRRFPARTR